jgi:hypothetical protein
MKSDLQEAGRKDVEWVHLDEYRDKRWAVASKVMNLRAFIKWGEIS